MPDWTPSPEALAEWGEACRGFAAITPMLVERGLLRVPEPVENPDA